MMRALGYDPTEKDIQNIIREIDANGDGKVDFPEFLQLMSQNVVSGGSAGDELLRTFKEFDKNGDGYINAAELYKIMTSWGASSSLLFNCLYSIVFTGHVLDPKVTEADVNEMIDDADIDGDHKISYEGWSSVLLESDMMD